MERRIEIVGQRELKQKLIYDQIVSLKEKPYEIMLEYTQKQTEQCQAIAINYDQTTMIAGCDKNIIVFEFKQGQLNQQQILADHSGNYDIQTLYFMRRYNQFISGTDYGEIRIWDYNNSNKQYYLLQMLRKTHCWTVNKVIMNENEDLIISCSFDNTIKFWIRKNNWECLQILRIINVLYGIYV